MRQKLTFTLLTRRLLRIQVRADVRWPTQDFNFDAQDEQSEAVRDSSPAAAFGFVCKCSRVPWNTWVLG